MNATIFIIYAIAFFGILIAIGIATKKWAAEATDFLVSGREIGLSVSISGILAISFAGTSLALIPSFAISHGFFGALMWSGIMSVGFAAYGLIYSGPVRRCGALTLPEWMEARYDRKTRTITSLGTILGLCGIMANNIASFAASLSVYAGIPTWVSIAICFIVMIIFTYASGMWAVNATNFFQMIIGLVALPLFAILVFSKFGGINFLNTNWPVASSWITAGFTGNKLPILSFKYPSILTFLFLNGVFLIWGSNYYWLRIVSVRTERLSRQSFVISAIIKTFVIYLPLIFIGLFAAASNTTAFAPVGDLAPVAAYGFMLMYLAAAVASFMLVASMAASLSTASTALMGATSSASRDLYQRNFKPNATAEEMLVSNRIIMVVIACITWLLCYFPGGPTYLFAFANSWMGPPSILLFLGFFWKRFSATAAFWSVVSGMVIMSVSTVLDLLGIFNLGEYMHVGVAGLFSTLAIALILSLTTKPKYYGESDWNIDPELGEREDIKLKEIELTVLRIIREGLTDMVEVSDYLGLDASESTGIMERLDRGGYIKRKALSGADFYSFEITKKGLSVLPKLTETEAKLAEYNLTPLYLEYLNELKKSHSNGLQFLRSKEINGLRIVAINSVLVRAEYVDQKGLFRGEYYVTEKGESAIEKFKDYL
ncbi:MAG TPA: sodium:solute symporter family protein [Thermoanaerobacterales bacterium]|nr:sodium:solute symporter family protein [Thermoanaerobacterales bacterium]